ncbi:MAG: 6-phosphofructokinase [Candidatus Margulisiibacteriota bacterium]|nr:6-phosphofructokinase [Candidatus Margulisiibacteriota bacterium]
MPGISTLITNPRVEGYRKRNIRIGILHSGGPAPGGNKVLYAAALRALDHGVGLVAFQHGYEHLMSKKASEVAARWAIEVGREQIRYLRDQNFLLPGTARANPGKAIENIDNLQDQGRTKALTKVIDVFEALRIGALISVGGDDTMRTANLLQIHHANLVGAGRAFSCFEGVVHVPKTIDKDYPGIDFTFGFITASQVIGKKIRRLRADARATATSKQLVYHIVEVMGRTAGWLTAASSIYGQATYAIIPEDFSERRDWTVQELAKKCADVILTRKNQGKNYGVITICEGLGDLIVADQTKVKDEFGHTRHAEADLCGNLKRAIAAELAVRSKISFKSTASKAGYEARQAEPNIFDELLCLQLGISAVNAVFSGKFGNMVSIKEALTPKLVPFSGLFDPQTVKVKNWILSPEEGLWQLLHGMEQPFETGVIDADPETRIG